MTTEILVCVTCQPSNLSRDEPRQGRLLFDALYEKVFTDELFLSVRPVECMSGCAHACTVAFHAKGKTKYLFGDLKMDSDSVEQILKCAELHNKDINGTMDWSSRPALFQKGLLARLPEALS